MPDESIVEKKKSKPKPMVRLTEKQKQDKLEFIEHYINADSAAKGSLLDANANVTTKTVTTLGAELFKDFNVQINRYAMICKIAELYGQEEADLYEKLLEDKIIYKHDESSQSPGTPYCVAINMYPFLEYGMTKLGGESKAPKHLDSYCGSFINLVFAIASQFAGAVATVEFLMYFDYFARKDYGDNYLTTHSDHIISKFQHVVYSLNQPAAARGYQSVFWNISIFDKEFFNSLFGNFAYPDENFTKPEYESVSKLQRFFMEWFLEERRRSLLTFPVITEASIHNPKTGIPIDTEFEDMCADLRSRGLSFFSYSDTDAAALASCCLTGDQVLTIIDDKNNKSFITIEDFYKQFKGDLYFDGKYETLNNTYSLNPENLKIEINPIIGIMKKKNTEKLFEMCIDGKKIKCTASHKFIVKNVQTDEIEEVEMFNIVKNPELYMIPTI